LSAGQTLSKVGSDHSYKRQSRRKAVFSEGTLFIQKMSTTQFPVFDPGHQITPEKEFVRQWVISLLNTVLRRLDEMCKERGTAATFEVLYRRLFLSPGGDYGVNEKIAQEMGITTRQVENHYKKALRWYRNLLREEVAACVAEEPEVEEEIRGLWRALD
jgi:hypothetical protein